MKLSKKMVLHIIKKGVLGLYRGIIPSVLAHTTSWGIYFGVYDKIKSILEKKTKLNHALISLEASFFSSIIGVLITNPLWVLRTRALADSSL